jgi:hypothetical protein
VDGTFAARRLLEAVSRSLFAAGGVYRLRHGGDLQYDGTRPAETRRAHAHGYFARQLFMLEGGRLVRRRLWKHRWCDREMGTTCHSRPPDDIAQVWSCSLIVTLMLWAWIGGGEGAERAQQAVESLEDHVSPRTVGRWLRRALPHAAKLEQAIRHALIERSEPRPVEHLFRKGLSPPEALLRRRWRCDPCELTTLYRALAFLFDGAVQLFVPVPCLLAEARGRMSEEHARFLM